MANINAFLKTNYGDVKPFYNFYQNNGGGITPQMITTLKTDLENKIDSVETTVNSISGNITNLQNEVTQAHTVAQTNNTDIATLRTTQQDIDNKVDDIKTKVTAIETTLNDLMNKWNTKFP